LTFQEKPKMLFLMMLAFVTHIVKANIVVIVNIDLLHMGLHQIGYG